jgi:hypothetical protein
LTPFKENIARYLLLVFVVSMLSNSMANTYTLYKADSGAEHQSASVYCKAGYSMDLATVFNLSDEIFTLDHQESDQNIPILNNCNSSLQILLSDEFRLIRSKTEMVLSRSIILDASQLFVHNIADPPRHV